MSNAFILASASPRRRKLLGEMGLTFSVVPSDIDEEYHQGESVRDHVMRLSREKAQAVSTGNPDAWVLGADTIVIIDGKVLGKPGSPEEARAMLKSLSGREHRVITGFAIVKKSMHIIINDAVESLVVFKTLLEDEVEWYVRTDEPYDKAGAYAVQGKAAFFIKEIRGSYTNVVGLPLCEVVSALKGVGAVAFQKGRL